MARRKRRSSSRRSFRRRRRNAYPILNPLMAVGNPRRRRRSRRGAFRARRRYRRSNPNGRLGTYVTPDIFKDVLWGAGGFTVTKVARTWISQFYPVGLTPQVEGALNVGVEVVTAAAGGMTISRFMGRSAGRAFAVGGLLYATWTLVGLVTGKPMSLSEYVAPRAMRLSANGRRRLAMNTVAPSSRLAAYPSAMPKAF